MPRLLRPPISVQTKCRVVLRQLGEIFPDEVIRAHRYVPRESVRRRSLTKLLDDQLRALADLLRCEVADLRLDHDPPLGARKKVFDRSGAHVEYEPRGSDPEHLFYRPHGAQHAGSHDVKTRVRGEHGQLSDIALVKRNRRLEEREGTRPKSYRTRMRERRESREATKPKVRRKIAAGFRSSADESKPKRKWAPGRKIQSRPFEKGRGK